MHRKSPFSPMNESRPRRFVREPHKFRLPEGLLLYLLPLPLVAGALLSLAAGDLYGVIVNTSGYLLYVMAATWMNQDREGKRILRHLVVKRKPRYRTRAALLVAFTTALLSWLGAGYSLWIVPMFGLGALWGMYLYYGFDAQAASGVAALDDDEVASAIAEAETILSQIDAANRRIHNREFNRRIERILTIAHEILDEIARDPGDLRRSRRFLKIYLEGTRKVTEGYASTHQHADSPRLEENFRRLLETIENAFSQQQKKLLENDLFDLDVQIEVLQTRLQQEGLLEPAVQKENTHE